MPIENSPISYYLSRSRKCTDTSQSARSHNYHRSTQSHTPFKHTVSQPESPYSPLFTTFIAHSAPSLRSRHYDALILSRSDILQGALKVPPRALDRRCVLVGLEIGVDELDKTVDVLDGDLSIVNNANNGRDGKEELTASFCWSK